MLKKFIDNIIAGYNDKSLQIQKKSIMLAWASICLGLLSIVLGVFLVSTGALMAGVITILLSVLCGASLILLRKGRYSFATSLVLFGLWFVCFSAIKGDAYKNVYETYVFGTLGGFLLIVGALLASRYQQVLVLGLLDIVGICLLYFLDSFPQDGYALTSLAVQNLAVSNLMILMGTIFSSVLVRANTLLMTQVEQEKKTTEKKFSTFNSLVTDCQVSADTTGSCLARSAGNTISTIQDVRASVDEIVRGMDELTEALRDSETEN